MTDQPVTRMFVRRRKLGMTQGALALIVGVTQPRISAWETRASDLPKARREAIARALGIDADTLTDDVS